MKVLSERDLEMLEAAARNGEPTHHAEVQKLINNLRADRAELERERTQNRDLRTAADSACVGWESDDPSDPNGWYLGQMRLMRLLRAALSTQEESK